MANPAAAKKGVALRSATGLAELLNARDTVRVATRRADEENMVALLLVLWKARCCGKRDDIG